MRFLNVLFIFRTCFWCVFHLPVLARSWTDVPTAGTRDDSSHDCVASELLQWSLVCNREGREEP